MKVIILAGGFGTRLSEYTDVIPKPMIQVGGKPILWHIMNTYAHYGHNDFYIALGYKSEVIKDYFLICESYYSAIKIASASKIQAIDMARRGLHNDGSQILVERLKKYIEVDFDTGRQLFTLLCVLHSR